MFYGGHFVQWNRGYFKLVKLGAIRRLNYAEFRGTVKRNGVERHYKLNCYIRYARKGYKYVKFDAIVYIAGHLASEGFKHEIWVWNELKRRYSSNFEKIPIIYCFVFLEDNRGRRFVDNSFVAGLTTQKNKFFKAIQHNNPLKAMQIEFEFEDNPFKQSLDKVINLLIK